MVSSTTKVLTDFAQLRQELAGPEFRYVVPDFRLNRAFDQLRTLPPGAEGQDGISVQRVLLVRLHASAKRCYEAVSRQNLGEDGPDHRCTAPDAAGGYRFSRAMESPGFIGTEDIRQRYLPAGFSQFKIEGRGLGSATGAGISALLHDKAGIPVASAGGNLSGQYAGSFLRKLHRADHFLSGAAFAGGICARKLSFPSKACYNK